MTCAELRHLTMYNLFANSPVEFYMGDPDEIKVMSPDKGGVRLEPVFCQVRVSSKDGKPTGVPRLVIVLKPVDGPPPPAPAVQTLPIDLNDGKVAIDEVPVDTGAVHAPQ